MKTKLQLLLLLAVPAMLVSCKDKIEEVYTVNEPVYLSYSDLRSSFKVAEGQDILQPGKIYFKDDYIFVNEYQKGIHVVDNANPADPQIVKFIEIPGNVDIAIREEILYADSYVDLLAIDISNMEDIKEVKRIENAFPYMVPVCEDGVVEEVDQRLGVVVSWKATQKTVEVGNGTAYPEYPVWREDMLFFADYAASNGVSGKTNTGTGGSLARFTVFEDVLYTVDSYALRLFDVNAPENPTLLKEMYVGWNIETLFPYDNKLFLGSTTGMYIYSLADRYDPQFISLFRHASSCDPVVVSGKYAYVTLRAGNLCGDATSQLDVIDISDLQNPILLKEYPMQEPYGLGIDESLLFVCDGEAGLKIFDATDPMVIDQNRIAHYPDINAFDVIPLGGILMMIGTDGLYQYDYTDPSQIRELSLIPISSLRH
jgi:hypothetical protein